MTASNIDDWSCPESRHWSDGFNRKTDPRMARDHARVAAALGGNPDVAGRAVTRGATVLATVGVTNFVKA